MNIDELKKHINCLVEYNWTDEVKDYQENPGREHILCTIVALHNFVSNENLTVDEIQSYWTPIPTR